MSVSRPTRSGAVNALAVALFVLGVQVVLQLLSTLLTATAYASSDPSDVLLHLAFPGYVFSVILSWLPFILGVFLTLWLLAPIVSDLRPGQVIVRSLLAIAGGTVIVFISYLGAGLLRQVTSSEGMVFGWAAAVIGSMVSGLDSVLGYSVYNALANAIGLGPLTVLAGVLVWVRLRERAAQGTHPSPVADV